MDIQNAHRAEREYMKVKARMDKDKAYLARLKESMEGFIEWGFTIKIGKLHNGFEFND